MNIDNQLIYNTIKTAYEAGEAILEIYKSGFEVTFKEDESPLTQADMKSHHIIVNQLACYDMPVLSEEGNKIDYESRSKWSAYWLIDPLDGTKEFVKRNGEFTVNIALIFNNLPILGVVYCPTTNEMYWGSEKGSFKCKLEAKSEFRYEDYQSLMLDSEMLPLRNERDTYIVLGSRSHPSEEMESYLVQLKTMHPNIDLLTKGSSLKFCTLAEGAADEYPRFGPTMEWDTAAGHAVAVFAGCEMLQYPGNQPFYYNKPSLLNPWFIAKKNKVTI
jgi:3'(2'), 5'-bisphosphate nucleotidase